MLHHRPGSISSPRVSSSGSSSGARAGQQRGKPLLGRFLKGRGRRGRREKGGTQVVWVYCHHSVFVKTGSVQSSFIVGHHESVAFCCHWQSVVIHVGV